MKILLGLLLGLVLGAGGMYWYMLSTPTHKMQLLLDSVNSADAETLMESSEVPFPEAKQVYCNYLSVCDSICPGIKENSRQLPGMNTRYLNIPNIKMLAMYKKFFDGHLWIDGIRIYPMVYPDSKAGERSNLINLMIVPYKFEADTIPGRFVMKELYTTNKDGLQTLFSIGNNGLENQIGQCPPSSPCNNIGSTLLQKTMDDMAISATSSRTTEPLRANSKIPKRVEWE